jgi:hypothetical protein
MRSFSVPANPKEILDEGLLRGKKPTAGALYLSENHAI